MRCYPRSYVLALKYVHTVDYAHKTPPTQRTASEDACGVGGGVWRSEHGASTATILSRPAREAYPADHGTNSGARQTARALERIGGRVRAAERVGIARRARAGLGGWPSGTRAMG